jgi:hypothetical protein
MTMSQNGAIVPVGGVSSSLPGPVTGDQLETQTHEIGLIVPPPDIKAIADKTAQFVAKNGAILASLSESENLSLFVSSGVFLSWLRVEAGILI